MTVTGLTPGPALYALWKSKKAVEFSEVKIITPTAIRCPNFAKNEVTSTHKLDSIDSYNHFMIYELHKHIETKFALVVQADGYVLSPDAWTDEFLEYDYVGAPWPLSESAYLDPFGNHQRVGNGGFSLRSATLMSTPSAIDVPFDVNNGDFYKHMDAGLLSEDGNICVHNRHIFESTGCRFAPLHLALTFSIEKRLRERFFRNTFGFHKSIPLRHKLADLQDRRRFKIRFPELA